MGLKRGTGCLADKGGLFSMDFRKGQARSGKIGLTGIGDVDRMEEKKKGACVQL